MARCLCVRSNADIEVTKRLEDKIHNIYFDPTGKHLLISLESGDNFYLNSRWKKVKALPKFKVRRRCL